MTSREGGLHPDRDAQIAHINASVTAALAQQKPVISVDTKKKELVGDFRHAGRAWLQSNSSVTAYTVYTINPQSQHRSDRAVIS